MSSLNTIQHIFIDQSFKLNDRINLIREKKSKVFDRLAKCDRYLIDRKTEPLTVFPILKMRPDFQSVS